MAKALKSNKKDQSQKKEDQEKEKAANAELKRVEAKYYNNPVIGNANVVNHVLRKSSSIEDVSVMMDDMLEKVRLLEKGDMSQIEEILLTQAHALQAMFVKAATQMAHAEYMSNVQIWGIIAMKAQNQCRQTLATLADIKNPKQSATFIKQQNNAVNQQINNQISENSKNIETGKNELLKEVKHETLDARGTPATIAANTQLEAMEAIDRG